MQDAVTVQPGRPFRLADVATKGEQDKADAKDELEGMRSRLVDLHEELWQRRDRAVLVLLQGLDTAGKDSTLRVVFSGLLPQALEVSAFVVPTPEEAKHDFLWRYHGKVPPCGRLGVFNRTWYEGVLVERVDHLVAQAVWRRRYKHINAFEALLEDSGVHLLKVFLHVSKDEQEKRLRKRAETPSKAWKHNPDDQRKHAMYAEYQGAVQDALAACSTGTAPWHVVPADHKPSRNLAVANLLAATLERAVRA